VKCIGLLVFVSIIITSFFVAVRVQGNESDVCISCHSVSSSALVME